MKHKILSKKANIAVSKAIKIITSVVLGSALMAGLCVTVKQTVLPTTTNKVESMFDMTYDIDEDLGDGVSPTVDRFRDGACTSFYYDTLQNAVTDASAHTTANANADENTANAVIDVRQSDNMYIVKPTKDQTVASSLAISNKVIFDTNGKQIQLAAGAEFKPQAGSEVTFRDSGTGKIYKDVDSSNAEMLINAQGVSNCTIDVLNGTYNLKNKSKSAFVLRSNGLTNIKKGSFTSSSETGNAMAVGIGGKVNITGGAFSATSKSAIARTIQLGGNETSEISGCKINSESKATSQGICLINNSGASLLIKDANIYSKSIENSCQGICMYSNGITNVDNCKIVSDALNTAIAISGSSNNKGKIHIKNGQYEATGKTACTVQYLGSITEGSFKSRGEEFSVIVNGATSIEGGVFESSTSNGKIYSIQNASTIKNAKIKAYATNDNRTHTARVCGIMYSSTFTEKALVENTSVKCDYNLESISVDDDYGCEGICNNSSSPMQSLTINNCNVKATREALSVHATNLYINGGTYEGIQHGGAYFGCPKAVVKNATFRKWNYDGQFNRNNFHSYNAAFYIGTKNNEVKVYMDNCKLENAKNAVLSSNYNYKNTYLYASNTAFNNIRIDGANSAGNKGHMYIGKGTTYQSNSGSGELDTVTYVNTEFTPEYVKNNFN